MLQKNILLGEKCITGAVQNQFKILFELKPGWNIRKDDERVITISHFFYTKPGPDAFFWAGEEGECDAKSIGNKSYNLAPGSQASNYFY